jgi:hypothetical protein
MRRHLSLLRQVLLCIEQEPTYTVSGITMDGTLLNFTDFSSDLTCYHVTLLAEANLVVLEAEPFQDDDGVVVRGKLTWRGQEFLGLARNPEHFAACLEQIGEHGNVELLEVVLLARAKADVLNR